jgi:hypothetical protein
MSYYFVFLLMGFRNEGAQGDELNWRVDWPLHAADTWERKAETRMELVQPIPRRWLYLHCSNNKISLRARHKILPIEVYLGIPL